MSETKGFEWQPFSTKQKQLLTWWVNGSPHKDKSMIICDGSIRAGKTVAMIDSFILWSLSTFQHQRFIVAGKSMGSIKRNILEPLFQILTAKGIPYKHHRSENYVEIGTNKYYLFGATNEASQDVLQGLTAAGCYLDEVVLFPQSFVNQAIGRCSIKGSKIWMNCNPGGPFHWIKTDLIDKANEKEILRLHFTLHDNPSLDPEIIERYERMYSGVFYQRNILGMWVLAEGLVYSNFDATIHTVDDEYIKRNNITFSKHWIGVDYGTQNATTFVLASLGSDNRLYFIDEYYHSGRETNIQKSPSQYKDEMVKFLKKHADKPIERIFIDPAATAFIVELYNARSQHPGLTKVAQANNDVLNGIRFFSSMITSDKVRVHKRCKNMIKEFNVYAWDEKASERGIDQPIKQNDHVLDGSRYLVYTNAHLFQKIMKLDLTETK